MQLSVVAWVTFASGWIKLDQNKLDSNVSHHGLQTKGRRESILIFYGIPTIEMCWNTALLGRVWFQIWHNNRA